MSDKNLTVEVILRRDTITIASGMEPLDRLTDDEIQIVASSIAYGLVEEAYGALEEDE